MTFGKAAGLTRRKADHRRFKLADTETKTHIKEIGTVIVPVSDQDRTLEFFTEKLGFEKRIDLPFGEGYRWLEVAPTDGQTSVAIVPPREGDPVGVETRIGFATDDVDADHAELRDRGVDVDEEVSRMGDDVPPMFFFRDPDGNRYLIVQRD
jgi:catechol 2,3-dioxygenase-like lactoylglutathione lyase family enzyme